MSSKECEEQLKSLIEHFKNGGLDFNATDIKAIEHLLLENRIQQDTIKKQNQENKTLHNKIDKAIEVLDRVITFCENDSQGGYDICNMAIRNYKNIRGLLKDSDVSVKDKR